MGLLRGAGMHRGRNRGVENEELIPMKEKVMERYNYFRAEPWRPAAEVCP